MTYPGTEIAHAATATGAEIVLIGSTVSEAIDRAALRPLLRLPARIQLWVGGPGAAGAALGRRARVVRRLEDLQGLLERAG